ncbi:hypothetical protein B0H63DRAFT_167629 [Podospora didyma]|uniref:Uncharacterized protein n=1 Tax=Podospora didyma TaxID=330526 RepID=A0AAE0U2B2_9PEZI|nr:hypothetical protein B0H63DRAFT_167629 [Podospora didyma]
MAIHPLARKIEAWVVQHYEAVPSPPSTILPLFFHFPGTCETDQATGSRFNMGQIYGAVKLTVALLKSGTSLMGEDIVPITPCRSNRARLQKALEEATDEHPGGRGVAVNTVEGF